MDMKMHKMTVVTVLLAEQTLSNGLNNYIMDTDDSKDVVDSA